MVGGGLARPNHLIAGLWAFDVAHSGALNGRDMDENVGLAVVGLNPAHGVFEHFTVPVLTPKK